MKYSEYFKSKNHTLSESDDAFCEWIDQVENGVMLQTGMSLLDLPDEMYMLSFENEISPDEIANEIISKFNAIFM